MTNSYDIYSLGIMIALISFLGFTLENLWLAATKGFMDNRNMHLPFLMGYGLLVVGMYLLLGTPKHMTLPGHIIVNASESEKFFIYFLCSMVIVTVGELILGHLVEKVCGFEYWNYNWIPLHITKYTSIPTSIGFSALITLFMNSFFEPIMNVISMMNTADTKPLSILLITVMSADLAVSFMQMRKQHGLNTRRIKYIRREPERLIRKT